MRFDSSIVADDFEQMSKHFSPMNTGEASISDVSKADEDERALPDFLKKTETMLGDCDII